MKDLLVLQHDIGQVNFNLSYDDWELFLLELTQHKIYEDED